MVPNANCEFPFLTGRSRVMNVLWGSTGTDNRTPDLRLAISHKAHPHWIPFMSGGQELCIDTRYNLS